MHRDDIKMFSNVFLICTFVLLIPFWANTHARAHTHTHTHARARNTHTYSHTLYTHTHTRARAIAHVMCAHHNRLFDTAEVQGSGNSRISDALYCYLSLLLKQYDRGGGGGAGHFHMHIRYVPRERPPFSALNFHSGAYHFHKYSQKYYAPEHHHFSCKADFKNCCRSGDHHFQNLFTFKPFIAVHGLLTAASSASSPGLAAGQSASQTRPSMGNACAFFTISSSGDPPFSRSSSLRTPPPPYFSLCRGTYLPKCGVSAPPPPPARSLIQNRIEKNNWAKLPPPLDPPLHWQYNYTISHIFIAPGEHQQCHVQNMVTLLKKYTSRNVTPHKAGILKRRTSMPKGFILK